MSINKAIKEGGIGNKKSLFFGMWWTTAAPTSQNRLHPPGRGPHPAPAEDKWNTEAFAGPQPHQSKQALEFRAVIGTGKALAGSQNKSSSGGFPGRQLTQIYCQRMQCRELCPSQQWLQSRPSAAALRPTSAGAATSGPAPLQKSDTRGIRKLIRLPLP